MNAQAMRRRLFLGTAVGALALRPSRTAQADTTFTNFRFAATGAPTGRTMPDRLGDVTNVKDWGATGNGRTNDGPAIQATIDKAIAAGGGTVYFPPGDYLTSSPIHTWRGGATALRLIGAGRGGGGRNASGIRYTGVGYTITHDPRDGNGNTILSNSLFHLEGLGITNGREAADAGAVLLAQYDNGVTIRGCSLVGFKCVDMAGTGEAGAFGGSMHDCTLTCPGVNNTADNLVPGAKASSVGVYLGEGIMTNCRVNLFDIGIGMSQNGSCVIGCSGESNNMLVVVGVNRLGATTCLGYTIQCLQTERNYVAIDILNGGGGLVAGNFTSGGIGPAENASVTNMTWANGVVTVTTPVPHHIAVGRRIIFEGHSAGWGNDVVVTATPSPTTFTYALATQPPSRWPGGSQWNYKCAVPLRLRSCSATFTGNIWQHNAEFGSADFDHSLDHPPLIGGGAGAIRTTTFLGESFPAGIIYPEPGSPSNAARAGLHFVHCTGVAPFMRFADLPGHVNFGQPVFEFGPFEDQQYTIIDGQKSGGGTAGWNDIVTGGGTGHYVVRYDGANWIRTG
jgi:hypothetical protein